jgi:hypothetical protein
MSSRHGPRRKQHFHCFTPNAALLRICCLATVVVLVSRERVYRVVAQKRLWYIRPSRGCCITTALHSIILSFSLRRRLPNGLSSSGFPTKYVYEFLTFLICATCPAYAILLDLTSPIIFDESTNYEEYYQEMSSTLLLLRPPHTQTH